MRVFYAQAFLLMGAFVTIYNLIGFHLLDDPYRLPASVVSLLFLTYLVGTVGSSGVGRLVGRFGRRRILAGAGYGMAAGVGMMLAPPLPVVLTGLVATTFCFFVAHAIAATWAGERVPAARSQASALYSLSYYAGSSVLGFAGALIYDGAGWTGAMIMVICCVVSAATLAVSRRAARGVARGNEAGFRYDGNVACATAADGSAGRLETRSGHGGPDGAVADTAVLRLLLSSDQIQRQ